MPSFRFPLPALMVLALIGLVAACDSGDPVDQESCADVAGRYQFTVFEFDPDANEIETVSILDTLDTGETELRLLNGCELILTYAFEAGTTEEVTTQVIDGSFTVTEDEIRLRADENDAGKLQTLYLSRNLNFLRENSDEIEAEIRATVDMYALTGRYQGVPPIQGTIRLRLERP